MAAKRGLFWYINGQLLCFPVSEGETDATHNNHQRFWNTLPHAVTGGKPYDHYPRGRVELRRGNAVVYLNPRLCTPEVYTGIRQAFSLQEAMRVSFKADGSRHYRCALEKEEE